MCNRGDEMQRRAFLLTSGGAVVTVAATGAPNLLFARDQSPSSQALEKRCAEIVAAYDAQGNHRTGTTVDNASAEWLVRQVQQWARRLCSNRLRSAGLIYNRVTWTSPIGVSKAF